ncbi:hypothetical protein [Pseudomonas aeruginosa]|uniref:hypothetical protein n=1 Tax=Pseudomonas aeruginosa TaxID=287 RepID=UPI0013016F44|nr:hypothetical protein [Pseudomonas aeruginosa]
MISAEMAKRNVVLQGMGYQLVARQRNNYRVELSPVALILRVHVSFPHCRSA